MMGDKEEEKYAQLQCDNSLSLWRRGNLDDRQTIIAEGKSNRSHGLLGVTIIQKR